MASRMAAQNANVSEAYDFKYDQSYRPVKRKRRVVKKKLRTKPVYVRREDARAKVSPMAFATILVIFICGFGIIYSFALVSDKQADTSRLRSELKTVREENAVLRAEVAVNKYSLSEIERVATQELGMTQPQSFQIVHINVPKQSYVFQNEDIITETESVSKLPKILSFIKGIWD